mgnify:CR=1 FL=1
MSAICLTFAESVENHVGNQQIGERCQSGWSVGKLKNLKRKLDETNTSSSLVDLNRLLVGGDYEDVGEEASVLVIKNCVDGVFGVKSNELFEHLKTLEWDKKYYDVRRKRVLNKNARWNLCFSDVEQVADYENGKGTVYTFETAGIKRLKTKIESMMSGKSVNMERLNAEGNYYYNVKKCGIGMHGDTERRKVFGVNLGDVNRQLVFQWYKNSKEVSDKVVIELEHGDCYIMSDKAVGFDWKKRSKLTLRHGAGIENSKYIK